MSSANEGDELAAKDPDDKEPDKALADPPVPVSSPDDDDDGDEFAAPSDHSVDV